MSQVDILEDQLVPSQALFNSGDPGKLRVGHLIGYRNRGGQSRYVQVLGRAGKVSGRHSLKWNVKNPSNGEIFVLDLKEHDVQHLGKVPNIDEGLITV